jgi:uncharacterized membrane protein YhhN
MKILSVLTFLSAALAIYFEYFDRRWVYLFKPLTMIFIISIVWFYGASKNFYRRAILAGLAFSLVGDTLLINPQNFVFGLASFLIAHLFYIAVFYKASEGKFNAASLAAFAIGAGMLWLIYSGVPANLKISVVFYALAISAMLAVAINFYLTRKTLSSLLALAGAFLFVVSDLALAYNKFGEEFLLAKLVILATYFPAQWLIARSA